jgi:serine/threonine protein kinase
LSSSRLLEPEQPEQIGTYRLAGVLGEGGQGTVYRAESPSGHQVVIKVLHARMAADDDERRRFAREMGIAGQVATFCTATVIEMGVFRQRPYIVSEYIPGPSLHELIQNDGPRTGSGLERLAVTTLTALEAIHRAGIVHRDFKPANVIMGPEGPVVIDFGIARLLDQATTRSGIVGTPAYMAPEQFDGRTAGPASDVFSWAITMVFAATGRRAFPGATAPAVIHAIMNSEPDLGGVPDPLRPLVRSCLAKDPDVRPTTQDLLGRLTTKSTSPQHGTPSPDPTPVHASAHKDAVSLASPGTEDGATRLYLRSYLRLHTPLAPQHAALFAADLADQLAALHAAGRAHGPLDAVVRVETAGGRARPVIVESGAPALPYKGSDDVRAVGMLLARLLGAQTASEEAPPRPDNVPGVLWSLITACLDADPALRVADLARRLRDAARELGDAPRPSPTGQADAPGSAVATPDGGAAPPGSVFRRSIASEPTAAARSRGRGRKMFIGAAVGVVLAGAGIVFAAAGPPGKGRTAVHILASTPVAAPSNTTSIPPTSEPPASRKASPSASSRQPKAKRSSPAVSASPRRPDPPSPTPQAPPSGGSTLDIATNYAWARGSVSWNGTTATANGRLQDTQQYESHSWLRIAYRLNVGGTWKVRYAVPDPFVEVSNGQYKDFSFSVPGPVKDVQWDVCSNRLDKTYCTGWK